MPNSSAPDLKYDTKFKYKYDNKGRRVEEAWYRNDGSLYLRYVSVYDKNGNKVEQPTYTENGVSERTVYDDKRNEIESTYFRLNGSIAQKLSHTSELDTEGNWVKRKTMIWVTRGGKSFFESDRVTYRQITYF